MEKTKEKNKCKAAEPYDNELAAAKEDIKKLLSGDYGVACEFCMHEADMSAPCTKGDKEWCRQHAVWKGDSNGIDKIKDLLERAAEEIENLYGKETELTEEIRRLEFKRR